METIAPPIVVEVTVDGCAAERCTESIAIATWQSWFQQWLQALAPGLSPIGAYELSLRLTDDSDIQSLNTAYRQMPRPTDVLAFAVLETELPDMAELHQQQPLYLGDIVISADTAARQAAEQGHSLRHELAWLAAHGLLHLLGWDHPDQASLIGMLAQQAQLLSLTSGTDAR
ncbi:rRNA maturation RNase YbeY [Romeria aff. gracilis LEGE 07310]|uniref:Endoribonuclease YbeY n=1 Tax=Vasconcelosia minhoensis LEGE 07310 TaxID=915328 RepID=A0A8J7ADJ0_9CYAN|nr:rRNA maturation RNase YbeY [Romeria gracilis]MBE9077966.1 rRNA maturation RNase YbeY [Romeria aff. gracilis LEGE 07310]